MVKGHWLPALRQITQRSHQTGTGTTDNFHQVQPKMTSVQMTSGTAAPTVVTRLVSRTATPGPQEDQDSHPTKAEAARARGQDQGNRGKAPMDLT